MRRAGHGTTDDRARGEGGHRIPPAIMIPAIAWASVTIAAMALPIARAMMIARAIVRTMMRPVMRTIVRSVMTILHFGHAIGLAGRLQSPVRLQCQWLRQGLDWPRSGRIDGRNGKQNTQGGG